MEKKEIYKKILFEIIDWIKIFVFAILIVVIIRGFVIEPVIVNGISMEDTLFNGQKLLIYKLGYFFHPPKRGDIVVLRYQSLPSTSNSISGKWGSLSRAFPAVAEIDYIKRVIGLPGDKIDIIEGYVYVNGEKLEEVYVKGKTYKDVMDFPVVVPENTVFVMGDNREYSKDSRTIGFVEFNRIRGKAILRIWPLKDLGIIK